jgi:hypothetical protein
VVHSIEMNHPSLGLTAGYAIRPGTDKQYLYGVGDLLYCFSLSCCILVSGVDITGFV